jgi:predicted nucleotide-binding protein (sugar kinase/HSP70/actin superfamily)
MTLPYVLCAADTFEAESERIMHPLIRFRAGRSALVKPLHDSLRRYGVRRREVEGALRAGEAALAGFRQRVREAGQEALATLKATREPAVLLVGRPYNLFDSVVNLDVPRKLRDLYGVNVLPLEFLSADDRTLEDVNANMFWSYGRKILAACRQAAQHSDMHLIYITNFKCGPDSYIKHFVRDAFGQAFLTLQFDGHANDAGMLTRVEAYLDSQGFLRRWKDGVQGEGEATGALGPELDERGEEGHGGDTLVRRHAPGDARSVRGGAGIPVK